MKFLSGEQNIIIEEEVAIKNENIIYKDDIVYLTELENQLLSEYPITEQGSKYLQKNIENISKKIIEVKNAGVKYNEMYKKGIEYNLVNDTINNKFNSNFIIPIILDKHKIYVKLHTDDSSPKENNENIDSNIYFYESLENKEGIIEENQYKQLITLKNLYHDKALNKIDFKSFLNQENNIINPYDIKYNNNENIGYIKKPLENTLVLRYYDINTIYWNTYKINNDYVYSKDILDETGKIKGIESNLLIKGDDINIIGFMILKNINNNILNSDIFTPTNYSNFLNKVFKKIGIITKILGSGNVVIVECKDHGLKNDEIIYIEDSNSFPKINNTYSKSLKIIDKDNIELNVKIINNGNYGTLYSISKLDYELYEIKKNDNEISIYPEKNINKQKNEIYLFDKININKNNYDDIIKKILPTLDEIMLMEMHKIQYAYSFDDINNIIQKYSLNINNLNIIQINKIKDIFKNNLEKLIDKNNNTNNNIVLNLSKNSKKYFNLDNYFLSNKYISNKNIEKIYGKYIFLNKPEDNIGLRIKWIESQKDNGEIYYLNFLFEKYETNEISKIQKNISFIENKIKELSEMENNIEKNLKKEKNINNKSKLYKYQAYIVTESDEENNFANLKKILEDNTVIFYKDNIWLWKGGIKKFENVEDNTITLVGNELWIWKKDNWYKSNSISNYDNIRYLCELNNIDLANIKLDSLDCIYRKDFGCNSKLYIRLNENMKNIKENLENFKKLEIFIKDGQYLKNINERIKFLVSKFYSGISKNKNKNKSINVNVNINKQNINKNNEDNKIILPKDELSVLITLILSIKDDEMRMHYIYKLIDKDTILIDNELYSKKYKRKIDICSHYIYFKKINYADDPNEKVNLINDMINYYSDYGETDKNIHTCKICGQFLSQNDYDETEGFSDSGMLKKSREIWVSEIIEKNTKNINLIESIKKLDLDDTYLKEIFLNYGLSLNDIDEAIWISNFILKNLFPKAGVQLPSIELINIIIDCMQKIKKIPPFLIYRFKEIKKYQEKGYSKIDIEKFDEKNIFKQNYDRTVKIKKSSIITSRFLISVQTSIPSIIRSSKSTICPYYSFEGDEGIIYMACVLNEMDIVSLKDKIKSLEILKISLIESYNDYKNLTHIRELFKNKKIYEIELLKKKESYKFKNISNQSINFIEHSELNPDYNNLIKQSKNIDQIRLQQNILMNRLYFIANTIKKTVKEVIEISNVTDIYTGLVESSCCSEDANSFLDYYFYIVTQSTYPIKKIIDESKFIFNYTKYFISIGSIHRFILKDINKFDGIYNKPIVDDEINTSQNLIKDVFKIYVSSGIFAGTLREYSGDNENQIDVKTGLTKKDILSKIYTIKEYQNLLSIIEQKNIKYYKETQKIIFKKDELDKLKKNSINKLDIEINNLIKNVASILNKDKAFISKYVDLMRNFGVFDKTNKNQMTEKDKIKNRDYILKKKLDYIKKFYITKFKKYLSIIKNSRNKSDNDVHITFNDTDAGLEIQSSVYKDNIKLDSFLFDNIRQYFIDLEIEYTNEQINSIYGMDNIYNSKYDKIKVYSDFNFNDASNVVLHMLISQLNNFILYKSNSPNKEMACKYICDYIMILLQELDEDNELFNLSDKCVEGMKNSLIYDIINYKSKMYFKEDGTYFDKMMKIQMGVKDKSIDEEDDNEEDTTEYIIEKGKKELSSKYGISPTENQLETYKNDFIENMQDEIEFEEEVYDLNGGPKGKEVLDQGAGYGELNEYDFETGDGFDYSDEVYD